MSRGRCRFRDRRWTAEEEAALTRLWNEEKLSGLEIAKRFGRSKNSVVGKARRLGLDARPSPILPPNPNSRHRRKRARLCEIGDSPESHWIVPILAPFEGAAGDGTAFGGPGAQAAQGAREGARDGAREEGDGQGLRHTTCQWLKGPPAARDFCGAPTVKGLSWCAHHAARVFRPAQPAELKELLEVELFSAPSATPLRRSRSV